MTDTDDLVKRLEAALSTLGRDWQSGDEFLRGSSQGDVDLVRDSLKSIKALTAQLAALRDEAKKTLGYFLRDDRFQVGVGGNPRVVEAMLSNAAALLDKLEDMK